MSQRKKIFTLIIIITIIFPFIIKSPISFIPLIYIILTIMVSLVYLLLIKNSCKLLVDNEENNIFKRLSSTVYNIKIINKSILIFPKVHFLLELENIDGEIFKKHEYEFMLNPKKEKELEIKIDFPHIGNYIIKISEIQIYGIFDLFCLKHKPRWSENISVVPKVYEIDDFDIDTKMAIFPVDFTVPHKIDGEIYDDIREYVPGDSIRNIHWKLSAHADEYMTKLLTTDAVSGITIYLDFSFKKNLDILEMASLNDAMIETAYAISIYAMRNQRGVSLIYTEDNNPTVKLPNSILDLREKIHSLPNLSRKEDYPMELLLSEYGNSISSLDNMFIITSNISIELINTLADFLSKGKRPILCLVESNFEDPNIKKIQNLLIESNIEYYLIKSAKGFIDSLGGNIDVKSE